MADAPPVLHDPVVLRRQYLSHEASIRSIGSLYYLGAVVGLLGGTLALLQPLKGAPESQPGTSWAIHYLLGPLLILFGFAYWKLGAWLRDLNPRGRIPATVLACIGLLGFPIGTLINAYILYLLNGRKAAVVFSEEYLLVIEATPEIKYRSSWIVISFAVLVGIVVVVGIVAAVLQKR